MQTLLEIPEPRLGRAEPASATARVVLVARRLCFTGHK